MLLQPSVEDIIATFLSCLQTLYTLIPVHSTQPCREVAGLIPSTSQLGLVLKELCRITLRLRSRGWLTEVCVGVG